MQDRIRIANKGNFVTIKLINKSFREYPKVKERLDEKIKKIKDEISICDPFMLESEAIITNLLL